MWEINSDKPFFNLVHTTFLQIITGEANFVVKNNLLDACLLVRQTVVALRNLSESSGDPSIEQTYQMAMILDESLTTLIPTVHLRREWRTLLHCTDKGRASGTHDFLKADNFRERKERGEDMYKTLITIFLVEIASFTCSQIELSTSLTYVYLSSETITPPKFPLLPGLVFHGEELFGTIKCTHRGKRQIGLLLAGIGVVASLYMTGKNAVKLRAIHRESDKARGERKHLAEAVTANFHRTEELRDRIQEVVDSTATSLDHINQRQTATEMYLLAQQAFNHMDRVVRSARRGEFEPTSLRESDFIEAIGRMREDADKKGMILNLEDGEELSQMAVLKTSYQIYEDGTFVAVTHIPMTNLNMQMSLYKVTSLPVKTDSGWFGVESKYQYIAVSKSRSSWYAPLTEMMYRACVGFGHGLSCRVPYYYTDSEIVEGESDGRCMFALYSGRSRDIMKACRIGRRVLDEVAVHLELRRYAIFTGERKRELILQCPGKEDRTMPAAEVHHVTLNSSCSATTGSIVIPGFESIDEEVEVNFAYQQLDVLTRLANETKETLNR